MLGAYERGERSISVPRLLRLAELYDVPVADLLEGSGRRPTDVGTPIRSGFPIDLEALAGAEGTDVTLLRRMVRRLQVQRQDFGGRVITVRGDDMRVLAAALGREPEDLERFYQAQGLRGVVLTEGSAESDGRGVEHVGGDELFEVAVVPPARSAAAWPAGSRAGCRTRR